MNWRSGFKRVAFVYLTGAILAVVGAAIWNLSQISCPPDYTIYASELRSHWRGEQIAAKREATKGKCLLLFGNDRERHLSGERAAQRLGLPRVETLPVCPTDALVVGPEPFFVDTTYVHSAQDIRKCRANLDNWQTTIDVTAYVIVIPLMLGLLSGLGFAAFRVGRWLYRGFKPN